MCRVRTEDSEGPQHVKVKVEKIWRRLKGVKILGRIKPGRCIIETKERLSRKGSTPGASAGEMSRRTGGKIGPYDLAFRMSLMIFRE